MEELRRIALELLALYEDRARDTVCERSTRHNEDLAELAQEIAEYRRDIESAK